MKMKLLIILAMAAAMFVVVSCKKEKKAALNCEYTGDEVPAVGGTATFNVKSNVEWKVTNADSWVTAIAPAEGKNDGSVTVTFAANIDAQERSSTFTVAGEDLTKTVVIKQKGAEGSLAIEYAASDIPAAGGKATFKVKTTAAWAASSTDTWVTEIKPAEGVGDANVVVTIGANETKSARSATVTVTAAGLTETVTIQQLAAVLPEAAGTITESDATPSSVVLNIAAISGAETYKWYKDGAEVQNTAARSYTATASGTYKVAGVNSIGEGEASPDHVVTLSSQMATLEDYLGDYVFNITYMDIEDESTFPGEYNDTMTNPSSDEFDLRFTNAIDQQNSTVIKVNTYMDFNYDSGSGKIALFADYWFDYLGTQKYYMMFAPCVLSDGYIYFVYDIELELNMETRTLAFPTELTSSDGSVTGQAYYINWAWDYSTKESLGRYSEFFMTDVTATKTGSTPAPARASSEGDRIVKIPVRTTPPPGIDLSAPMRADQAFNPR